MHYCYLICSFYYHFNSLIIVPDTLGGDGTGVCAAGLQPDGTGEHAKSFVASTSSPSLLYGFVNARLCVPTAYAMFNYV
jgi:hypothetical protein